MKLVNYHHFWMHYPTKNGVPLYRRRLITQSKFHNVYKLDGITLDDTEILSAELNEMNGNVLIETINGDRLYLPHGSDWSVECYTPTGELSETIKLK